jgi:hypothetical protein
MNILKLTLKHFIFAFNIIHRVYLLTVQHNWYPTLSYGTVNCLSFELFTVNWRNIYNNIISLNSRIQDFLKIALDGRWNSFHVPKWKEMKELMNEWKKQRYEKGRHEREKRET